MVMTKYNGLLVVASLLAIMTVAGGCGGDESKNVSAPSGYTEVKFNSGRDAQAPRSLMPGVDEFSLVERLWSVMNGGIYIYVQGPDFSSVFFMQSEESALSVIIPNGTYSVFAIGYSGGNMGAPVKCGYGNNRSAITLDGHSQTISVVLNQPHCIAEGNAFSDPAFTINNADAFKRIVGVSCKNTVDIASASITSCQSTNAGNIASMRIALFPTVIITGQPLNIAPGVPVLASGCMNVSSGVSVVGPPVPVGPNNMGSMFFTKIDAFSNADCPGESFLRSYTFSKSLLGTFQPEIKLNNGTVISTDGVVRTKLTAPSTTNVFLRDP